MRPDLVLRGGRFGEGILTIHMAGVVDAHTLDRFEGALAAALKQGARSLVLDCEEVRYVNSAGFGEIIRYSDRLRQRGGSLILARVPPKVGVILEMLGLKSLVPVVASLEDALSAARSGPPKPTEVSAPQAERSAAANRLLPAAPQPPTSGRTVACAFCDTRIRIAGAGRWVCPACGAPFTITREGGVAFDWSGTQGDSIHVTLETTPRTLSAFAGMLEGLLMERRVEHGRLRRLAREAAHVCHVLAERGRGPDGAHPLHVLIQAAEDRLHLRIVDRAGSAPSDIERLLGGTEPLFRDFRQTTLASGVHLTEFGFAYEEAEKAAG